MIGILAGLATPIHCSVGVIDNMTDELLDLVDEDDNVVGTVLKSEAHSDPKLRHREVAVCIFNDRGEVLFQRRSMKKKNSPGKWTVAASGHVVAREDPKESARREVWEEVGFDVKPVFFEKQFMKYKNLESRFFWIYYAKVIGRPKLKLNKEEVMDARWVGFDNLGKFAKNNDYSTTSESHKILKKMRKTLGV